MSHKTTLHSIERQMVHMHIEDQMEIVGGDTEEAAQSTESSSNGIFDSYFRQNCNSSSDNEMERYIVAKINQVTSVL